MVTTTVDPAGELRITPATPVRPGGLGVAIVFDWALAAQLTVQAVASAGGWLGIHDGVGGLVARLIGAAVMGTLGEALRRGIVPARLVQIVLTGLLAVAGVVSVIRILTGGGGHGLILSAIVQCTFAPFVAVRLAAPRSAQWFRASRGRLRAPRTSGLLWVSVLAAWSLAWGALVAVSQSL